MKTDLEKLIEHQLLDKEQLIDVGRTIGRLYTDMGLPIDIALEEIHKTLGIRHVALIDGICQWMIEHKIKSGAGEASLERQDKSNRKMVINYLSNKEIGVY